MYQVIEMYGYDEPWWFFEDWQSTITNQQEFRDYASAKQQFDHTYHQLAAKYSRNRTKGNFLSAFWNPEETRYCEDCEDDLQLYCGLLILRNDKPIEN